MPKTADTEAFAENRNCSDSNAERVPIPDLESELLCMRIKSVVGEEKKRAFARRAGISDTALRSYISGSRKPKREAIEGIARAGHVSPDWLATGKGEKSRQAYVTLSAGGGKTNTSLLAMQAMAEYKPDTPTRNTKPTPTLIEKLLQPSLAALQLVYGDQFKAEPASLQLDYAMNLSDLLIGLAAGAPDDRSPLDVARLSIDDLAAQLRVFLALGWARSYPPPDIPTNASWAW